MLKKQLIKQFANPKAFEEAFYKYLAASGAKMVQDKTIAYQVLNDARQLNGQTITDYFTGPLDPQQTNIENSYTRPESEHFLIVAIRCYYGSGAVTACDFTRGIPENINTTNSTIDLYVNSVRMLKEIPLTVFNENTFASENRGTLLLDEPILWQGQEDMLLQVKNKSNEAFSNECLRFDLVGIGMI